MLPCVVEVRVMAKRVADISVCPYVQGSRGADNVSWELTKEIEEEHGTIHL